jgi:RNA polymerase-binding transcription factor DksA
MDDVDHAQQIEQSARDMALKAHAGRPRPATPANGCCLGCSEPIALARLRALGATEYCAECARDFERQAGRRYG